MEKKMMTPNAGKRVACTTQRLSGDLIIDRKNGIAYQQDRSVSVPYDDAYFDKTAGKTLKEPINKYRKELVYSVVGKDTVLDFGCGDCAFIETRPNTWGYDICPQTIKKLKDLRRFHHIEDGLEPFSAITFFDSLEHLPEPKDILKHIKMQYVIVIIPIIEDILKIKQWKHYRPNEHYWNFTNNGFIEYMGHQGFNCCMWDDGETKIGRTDIQTFVFKR